MKKVNLRAYNEPEFQSWPIVRLEASYDINYERLRNAVQLQLILVEAATNSVHTLRLTIADPARNHDPSDPNDPRNWLVISKTYFLV